MLSLLCNIYQDYPVKNSCLLLILILPYGARNEIHLSRLFFPSQKMTNFVISFSTTGIFFCDAKGSLGSLLVLNPIFCKVLLVVRWDMLCDAPAFISFVICRVVALLLPWTVLDTRL